MARPKLPNPDSIFSVIDKAGKFWAYSFIHLFLTSVATPISV
ncbi:unnamed protein product, partial [marine sediment metagenome]